MNVLLAMLNIFVDPAAAMERVRGRKWAWLAPALVVSVFTVALALTATPISLRIMLENPPQGVNPEQLERSLGMIQWIQRITSFATPLYVVGFMAVMALVVLGMCSAFDVRARFGDLFNMMCYCGLITTLQLAASILVLRLKGDEVERLAELQPPFGLGLLLPHDSHRLLLGFVNYFSVFNLWYIAVLGLAFSALTKSSKATAFAATAPVWIIGLFLSLLGALFQPS